MAAAFKQSIFALAGLALIAIPLPSKAAQPGPAQPLTGVAENATAPAGVHAKQVYSPIVSAVLLLPIG